MRLSRQAVMQLSKTNTTCQPEFISGSYQCCVMKFNVKSQVIGKTGRTLVRQWLRK